jgi:hypothetical protein
LAAQTSDDRRYIPDGTTSALLFGSVFAIFCNFDVFLRLTLSSGDPARNRAAVNAWMFRLAYRPGASGADQPMVGTVLMLFLGLPSMTRSL